MSVSSSDGSILDLAATLRRARETATSIAPVRGQLPGGVPAAYAVQAAITTADLQCGRRLVGRKIGLTSRAVQRQLGVAEPDFGTLFADMNCDEHEPIGTADLIAPKIEAEIAFVLGRSIEKPDPTLADVLHAIDYALPALEIVDSRIADWNITILDTVADNASSALFVLGATPASIRGIDLALAGMVMEVDGDPVSFGAGAACLGHPLGAVRWLARRMQSLGSPLQAGDIILSGALGPMAAVAPGSSYEARISGIGTVRASFRTREQQS